MNITLYIQTECLFRCILVWPVFDKRTQNCFLTTKTHRDCTWLMETQCTNPTCMPMRDRAANASHWMSCHTATWEMIWSFWMIWGQSSRPWEGSVTRQFKKETYSFEGHRWSGIFVSTNLLITPSLWWRTDLTGSLEKRYTTMVGFWTCAFWTQTSHILRARYCILASIHETGIM